MNARVQPLLIKFSIISTTVRHQKHTSPNSHTNISWLLEPPVGKDLASCRNSVRWRKSQHKTLLLKIQDTGDTWWSAPPWSINLTLIFLHSRNKRNRVCAFFSETSTAISLRTFYHIFSFYLVVVTDGTSIFYLGTPLTWGYGSVHFNPCAFHN